MKAVLVLGILTCAAGASMALAAHREPAKRVIVEGHQIRYNGLGPERWARRYRIEHNRFLAERRHRRRLQREFRRRLHTLSLRRLQARQPSPIPPDHGWRATVWDRLADCESGGDWSYNGSSGFDGGVQFHPGTWSAYRHDGEPAYAYQATREQQIAVAERVLAAQGWSAWPACAAELGLR